MKKGDILIVALLVALGSKTYAQNTGINTKNPKGTLHVDSAKNNSPTGAPSTSEQTDDFIITSEGNVGIGTIEPNTRLHINSSTAGALQIQDGTQSANKLLVSNANGVGSWVTPAASRPTILGNFPNPAQTINTGSGGNPPIYSQVYIDLPPGKWAVSAGMKLENLPTGTALTWVHAYLSTSNTATAQVGFTHLGPANVQTAYAGVMPHFLTFTGTPPYAFIYGTSIIQVTNTAGVRIYLMLEKLVYTYKTDSEQNYFYAVPLN